MSGQSSVVNPRSSVARAFALVEMLVLIMTAPILMILISGFFRSFIRDIPQGIALVQQNTTVANMLDQLQMDIDRAIGLPGQVGGRQANDAALLIRRSDGIVCYRLEQGRFVRARLDEQGEPAGDGDRVWRARNAVVEWRPWARDGHVYAMEVHSYLNQRAAGKVRRKFVNTRVFFVGSPIVGGEMQ